MNCIICNNPVIALFIKKGTQYHQCISCRTVFSGPLKNDGMVGGGHEIERNTLQNAERIERIKYLAGGDIQNIKVLDFGCGHGMFVEDLQKAGINATGYDPYNPDFNFEPLKKEYDIVTAVEVFEHLSYPFNELDLICMSLKKGANVYVETSFVDIAYEDGIPLDTFFYISPDVGHSTVFSHHGLDVEMCKHGFVPQQHFNRNTRIYKKV